MAFVKKIVSGSVHFVSIIEPLFQVFGAIFYLVLVALPLSLWFVLYDLCSFPFRKPPVNATNICITGASSGLGKAFAVEYAKPGVKLGLFGRNEERLKAVAEECTALGAKCTTFCVDISKQDELEKALHTFDDAHPIDLFFANAGQAGTTLDNRDQAEEDHWRRLVDVNIIATMSSVMIVYKRMRSRRHGQIAITSSVAGYYSPPLLCTYNVSKSALITLARDLRSIAQEYNVHVTLITPGFIESPLTVQEQSSLLYRLMINSAKEHAEVVRLGLERDAPAIGWPRSHLLQGYMGATTPPRITPVISGIFQRAFRLVTGSNADRYNC